MSKPVSFSGISGRSSENGASMRQIPVEEEFYIRPLTVTPSKDVSNKDVYTYSWERVTRSSLGVWIPTGQIGGQGFDPAYEVNNANTSLNVVYRAYREAQSTQVVFMNTSGGQFKATSNSIIMLLGTYDQYKNCPGVAGVAGKPPTDSTGALCGNYYAWAEYAVCGYKMKKLRDMRDFPYWAQSLNNPTGSAAGLRRLYNASFGDPSGNCQGVRYNCGCDVSDLICTCPDWMTPVKCLTLTFKTVPRPCPADSPDPYCGYSCSSAMRNMDQNNMWDKQYTVQLCSSTSCFFQGNVGTTGWESEIQFLPAYQDTDVCFWGPDTIDPCTPCLGFGEFRIDIMSGDKIADCGGAGVLTGTITDVDMLDLVTNCVTKKPTTIKLCNGCKNSAGQFLNLVDPLSVTISCCSPKNKGTCP